MKKIVRTAIDNLKDPDCKFKYFLASFVLLVAALGSISVLIVMVVPWWCVFFLPPVILVWAVRTLYKQGS